MAWDVGGGGRARAGILGLETKEGGRKEKRERERGNRGRGTGAPENSNKLSFAVQYSFRPHNNPARRWHCGRPEKILIQSGKCTGVLTKLNVCVNSTSATAEDARSLSLFHFFSPWELCVFRHSHLTER